MTTIKYQSSVCPKAIDQVSPLLTISTDLSIGAPMPVECEPFPLLDKAKTQKEIVWYGLSLVTGLNTEKQNDPFLVI